MNNTCNMTVFMYSCILFQCMLLTLTLPARSLSCKDIKVGIRISESLLNVFVVRMLEKLCVVLDYGYFYSFMNILLVFKTTNIIVQLQPNATIVRFLNHQLIRQSQRSFEVLITAS